MGVTFYKVTGILLSVTVVVLGAVTTIVLYFAGQSAIDFFYTGTTRDVDGRIHRRQPTDDWYGVFFLRDWAFGFVMGVSVVVEILAVTAGSFLHTAGALGLLIYYSVVAEGASKHDPTDTYPIQPVPVNERCEQGRKLFALAVGAVCVAFLAWFLTLITLLCRGFLIHHVPKPQLEPARIRRRRQGMARPVASASDADRQADIGMAEGARPKDGGGAQRTTPEVGIDEKVTMAALVGCTTDSSYVAGSTPEFHLTETSEPSPESFTFVLTFRGFEKTCMSSVLCWLSVRSRVSSRTDLEAQTPVIVLGPSLVLVHLDAVLTNQEQVSH
ncbi:hypothetical protein MAR_017807 [Mya arenaria]|uniref:Uncharacterized protein n=1 Tax=Mya arenaria TaxID=6604 RepID=A0ABY7EHI2_MYAAR|nr:hypothetical protein MAR_017807 [Mya arenaria]